MWRCRDAFCSVLDVASICELMGVYSNVAVVVVGDHGNGGVPVVGVGRVCGAEVMVDGIDEGISIK